MSALLAVIIPAYRAEFLAATLASLAAQTDRRFHVYVADDGSPEAIASIVENNSARLNLTYHRFAENLGRTSLVAHWHRAIALSHEPWIWLFSDDDVADAECVSGFLAAIEARPSQCELVRVPLSFIDGAGKVIVTFEEPRRESATELYRGLLDCTKGFMSIQNYVFSRAIYTKAGGFPDLPKGWAVDLVTWVRYAVPGGVTTAEKGRVFYRRHGSSISGHVTFDAAASVESRLHFLLSAARFIEASRVSLGEAVRTAGFHRAELRWYCRMFRWLPRPLARAERMEVRALLSKLWPDDWVRREVTFWNCWARPVLRQSRLYRALATRLQRAAPPSLHDYA